MSDPVVLITGALTGIGRSTAIAFAKEGARLVVAAPLRRTARRNRQRHPVFFCSEASFTTGQVLPVSMAGSRRCEK